jgi:hypothetical protein
VERHRGAVLGPDAASLGGRGGEGVRRVRWHTAGFLLVPDLQHLLALETVQAAASRQEFRRETGAPLVLSLGENRELPDGVVAGVIGGEGSGVRLLRVRGVLARAPAGGGILFLLLFLILLLASEGLGRGFRGAWKGLPRGLEGWRGKSEGASVLGHELVVEPVPFPQGCLALDADDPLVARLELGPDLVARHLRNPDEFGVLVVERDPDVGLGALGEPRARLFLGQARLVAERRNRQVVQADHVRSLRGEEVDRDDLGERVTAELLPAASCPERRRKLAVVAHQWLSGSSSSIGPNAPGSRSEGSRRIPAAVRVRPAFFAIHGAQATTRLSSSSPAHSSGFTRSRSVSKIDRQ